jgi:hypothetical protein
LSFLPRDEDTRTLDLQEMEELGEAVRDKMSEYGLKPSESEKYSVRGSEVGDDRVDASLNPTPLATMLVVQEKIVGMRTSEDDTAISTRLWNFCEVTSFVPTDRNQSFDYARKVNDFVNLGFNDSIVLRIIMDVSKGDMSHSSTPVGKMTLLGAKMRSPRAEHRLTWHIASWLQDAYLNTRNATDPKYLPAIMGGAGVPVLYDDPLNLSLFVRAYRGGGYQRIYGTCTAELESCLSRLEQGKAAVPFLCTRMRERQEYFHGTYAEKVFIPKQTEMGGFDNVPLPLYEATGAQNRLQAFENRLVRTRHLVSRSEAMKELLHTEQLGHILLGHRGTVLQARARLKDMSHQARYRYGMALSANSALQNLLRRKASPQDVRDLLGDSAFRVISTGQVEFTAHHAQWICAGGKSTVYSIMDLTTSEDMFVREEVSHEESFKVPGIPLTPIVGDRISIQRTKARVGLYQINKSMEEWAEDLTSRLVSRAAEVGRPLPIDYLLQECHKDPEWVNDDSHLVKRAIDLCAGEGLSIHNCITLVSSDKRLANQMANQANTNVYRLSPADFVKYCHYVHKDPQAFTTDDLREIENVCIKYTHPRDKPHVLIDTGSLAAAMAHFETMDAGNLAIRKTIRTGVNAQGSRTSTYVLTKTEAPYKRRLERITPILRPHFYRNTDRGEASNYSSSRGGSWRTHSNSEYV